MKLNVIIFGLGMLIVGCQSAQLPVDASTRIPASTKVATSTPELTPTTSDTRIDVAITKNITYTIPLQDEVSSDLALDIYAPEKSGSWPVVIFLHGGVGQKKDDQAVTSKMLAEQGYVVFTPTWPVSAYANAESDNGRGFREIAESVDCAVRFAFARAPDFGGDTTKVIIAGFSAGGGAGATAALMGREIESSWDAFASNTGGPLQQVSCVEDQKSRDVFAFVGIGGYYNDFSTLKEDDKDLWALVSYQALIRNNTKLEVRLIHGEKDETAHFWRVKLFEKALIEAEYKVILIAHSGSHYVPRTLFFDTLQSLVDN